MTAKNICPRAPVKDSNGVIFGRSGSGKSAAAKLQIMDILEHSENDCVYVVDVYGEYTHLAEKLHGKVISLSLSPASRAYLNPLDTEMGYGDKPVFGKSFHANSSSRVIDPEADSLDMKVDYVISMIGLMLGSNQQLDPQTKAVIARCVCLVYKPYVEQIECLRAEGSDITCDKSSMPTLATLYNELRKQPEPEAQMAADVMECYVEGNFALFSHCSNVNSDARFMVYNCRMLGEGMAELGMFACLNDIWNKMVENGRKGLRTWVYIEDMVRQLIYCRPTRQILFNMYGQAQIHHGNMIGISGENVDGSMKDVVGAVMPSGFVSIMAVDRSSREILKDSLNLSEEQKRHITPDVPHGHGLFCTEEGCRAFTIEPSQEDMEYIRI